MNREELLEHIWNKYVNGKRVLQKEVIMNDLEEKLWEIEEDLKQKNYPFEEWKYYDCLISDMVDICYLEPYHKRQYVIDSYNYSKEYNKDCESIRKEILEYYERLFRVENNLNLYNKIAKNNLSTHSY